MRIICWNCRRNFRSKFIRLLEFQPDIVVISECEKIISDIENTNKFNFKNKFIWFGERGRGVGVIAFSDYILKIHEMFTDKFKYVIPIKVEGKNNFNLIAVWTIKINKKVNNRKEDYLGQLGMALEYYEEILNEPTIIIGDYNMDKRVEIKHGYKDPARITTLLEKLSKKNILSVYHKYFNEELGKESRSTYYDKKKKDSGFHNDYCFASKDFIERLEKVIVGNFGDWIKYSDHMPIIVEFKDKVS